MRNATTDLTHATAYIGYTRDGRVVGAVQPTDTLGPVAYVVDADGTVWFPFRAGYYRCEDDALVAMLGIAVAGAEVPGMRHDAAKAALAGTEGAAA